VREQWYNSGTECPSETALDGLNVGRAELHYTKNRLEIGPVFSEKPPVEVGGREISVSFNFGRKMTLFCLFLETEQELGLFLLHES